MPESRKPPGTREVLLDALLDQVADDRYPSVSTLDMIESLLRPDEVESYVRLLLRKVRRDRYPSMPMLRRISELVQ
jgi:hypothetical protein